MNDKVKPLLGYFIFRLNTFVKASFYIFGDALTNVIYLVIPEKNMVILKKKIMIFMHFFV